MRSDNTRCTAGLVFLGPRPLDLELLAQRLDRVLGARGFEVGASEMLSGTHLKMGLGPFDLHMNMLETKPSGEQSDQMQQLDQAMGDGQQRQSTMDLSVAEATLTLTVTIVKLPSDLPSLREAERSTVTAHSALALATLELAQVLDPDFVQWLQPDMMLQTSSFLSVLEKVTPRRVSAADRARNAATDRRRRPAPVASFSQTQANRVSRLFPDIEDTCERLEERSKEQTPAAKDDNSSLPYLRAVFRQNDDTAAAEAETPAPVVTDEPGTVSRLATWAISLTVALISLPVGLTLMVYNLLRGEDLRLACYALALTGFFVGMSSLGLTQRAFETITALPLVTQVLAMLPV